MKNTVRNLFGFTLIMFLTMSIFLMSLSNSEAQVNPVVYRGHIIVQGCYVPVPGPDGLPFWFLVGAGNDCSGGESGWCSPNPCPFGTIPIEE